MAGRRRQADDGQGGGVAISERDVHAPEQVIHIQRLLRQEIEIRIVGVTPLIMHAFSEKSRREMDLGQKLKADKKARRTPTVEAKPERASATEQFERARYRLPDGRDGIPATAVKAAIVDAARFFPTQTMADLKRFIFVFGEGPDQLIPIEAAPPVMREDITRASDMARTPLLTYRPMYWPWAATLRIRFNASMLSAASIVNLVDASGDNGIGEWRPSSPKAKNGSNGMYRVVAEEERKRG